jgi:hypothetical protein
MTARIVPIRSHVHAKRSLIHAIRTLIHAKIFGNHGRSASPVSEKYRKKVPDDRVHMLFPLKEMRKIRPLPRF